MAASRTASVVWEGELFSGKGTATLESSGLARDLPVSWPSRTEEANGQTSPEELIAAAHASCFSMAFSKQLNDRNAPPQRLETSATVTFVPGTGITTSELTVRVTAEGLEQAALDEAAAAAKDGCPVSQALKGNVEISVDASLA
ncbi:MAG: OsmC family peroxiredoxin [Ilumatobacteraceae bacterium]